ncbi:MAG: coenzyme F420 hydrogenase subunit alpha, partial [Methanothermobacter sp.]
MSEKVVISPTSRQEGHAELVMEVDDEGIVTKGRYFSITPVRGL